jgi:hypothetical protein
MDARLDPAKFAGLAEGDAHVIRNAGGRASDDAIRSLIISHKLLGTNEWFVIHHTDCGMETFTDEVMHSLLRQSLDTAELRADGWHDIGRGPGSSEGDFIDWLTIENQTESGRSCGSQSNPKSEGTPESCAGKSELPASGQFHIPVGRSEPQRRQTIETRMPAQEAVTLKSAEGSSRSTPISSSDLGPMMSFDNEVGQPDLAFGLDGWRQ